MVRIAGLEPARVAPLPPQSSASGKITSCKTVANKGEYESKGAKKIYSNHKPPTQDQQTISAGGAWHVEIMTELVAAGEDVASIVRSQSGWQKIKPKVTARWKVYRLARKVMEESLPKLRFGHEYG